MIQVHLFGSLQVSTSDGRPLGPLLRRPRRTALLAWLAAHAGDGMQRRDTALALFWPELDAARARAALSQSLYVLREALGESAIVTRGHHEIGVSRAHVWCDVPAFEAALAEGRLTEALALYNGHLLDGFFVSDAPGFERWIDEERVRLRHRAAEAAWTLAEDAVQANEHAVAKRWAVRAVALQPVDETEARRLMVLLLRIGDRAAALRSYEEFVHVLEREYELAPSAETRALARALRDARHDVDADDADAAAPALPADARRPAHPAGTRRWWLKPLVALAAAAVVLTTAVRLGGREPPALQPVLRFPLLVPVATGQPGSTIALSPRGDQIVYVGTAPTGTQLYRRRMDRLDATPVPHTEGAALPFFSPDGAWLGFVTGSVIRRVPVEGGPASEVHDAGAAITGATWTTTQDIVFATAAGLWRVPAAGGGARMVAAAPRGRAGHYAWPEALPGGRHAILTRADSTGSALVAVALETGRVTELGIAGTSAHFVEPDRLVFARADGALLAHRFDPERLRVTGAPRRLVADLVVGINGGAKVGVSRNGTIAYVPDWQNRALAIVHRSGRESPLPVAPHSYSNARVSPDGTLVATTLGPSPSRTDAWVIDLHTGVPRRLTWDSATVAIAWVADGSALIVATHVPPGRGFALRRVPIAHPDAATVLVPPARGQLPGAVTPDGRTLVFQRNDPVSLGDLWLLRLEPSSRPVPLLVGPANERGIALSPDGRWLAYVSDASGSDEVYVRPLAATGAPVQVSNGGGREPRWSPSSREIFYRSDRGMSAASVHVGSSLRITARTLLFDERAYLTLNGHALYDVLPDGERFVMIRRAPGSHEVVVMLNAFSQLDQPGQ